MFLLIINSFHWLVVVKSQEGQTACQRLLFSWGGILYLFYLVMKHDAIPLVICQGFLHIWINKCWQNHKLIDQNWFNMLLWNHHLTLLPSLNSVGKILLLVSNQLIEVHWMIWVSTLPFASLGQLFWVNSWYLAKSAIQTLFCSQDKNTKIFWQETNQNDNTNN